MVGSQILDISLQTADVGVDQMVDVWIFIQEDLEWVAIKKRTTGMIVLVVGETKSEKTDITNRERSARSQKMKHL